MRWIMQEDGPRSGEQTCSLAKLIHNNVLPRLSSGSVVSVEDVPRLQSPRDEDHAATN